MCQNEFRHVMVSGAAGEISNQGPDTDNRNGTGGNEDHERTFRNIMAEQRRRGNPEAGADSRGGSDRASVPCSLIEAYGDHLVFGNGDLSPSGAPLFSGPPGRHHQTVAAHSQQLRFD